MRKDHSLFHIYKVVPPFDSVQLVQITPIAMVFVGDISTINGIINKLITWGGPLCNKKIWGYNG